MRIRHVVSSGEVPHLWFHKTQASARTGGRGNLYFENDTIYSYGSHFPIARHVSNGKANAVLFTTRTYSVTTSGHCSAVRSAIPSSALVFHVPELSYIGQDYKNSERNEHKTNIADYIKRIETSIITSARACSSWRKESSHRDAVSLLAELKAYAAFFRLELPKLPNVPALDSREMAAIKTREAKRAAIRAEETRKQREEQARFEREKIERWHNGENVGYLYNVPCILRISGEDVETSRGARVPISHAKRGLRFVRSVVASGQAYVRNGHTLHLGVYAIDKIDADGTLHAGCHVISYAEIERLAPLLESSSIPENEVQS